MDHEFFLTEYQKFSAQGSRSLLPRHLELVYEIKQEQGTRGMKQARRENQFRDALSGEPPLWAPSPVKPSNLLHDMQPKTVHLMKRKKHNHQPSFPLSKGCPAGYQHSSPCFQVATAWMPNAFTEHPLAKNQRSPGATSERYLSPAKDKEGIVRWPLALKLVKTYSVTQVWLGGRGSQRIWGPAKKYSIYLV